MTKVTTKYYVLRNKENGTFLKKFHDKGTLAYHTETTEDIHKALTMIPEAYEVQKKQMKMFAKALGAEIIEVNATFELTYPNGDEIREIEKDASNDLLSFGEFLKAMLGKEPFEGGE